MAIFDGYSSEYQVETLKAWLLLLVESTEKSEPKKRKGYSLEVCCSPS